MASGKKGKKPKWKTLGINELLQEPAGSVPSQPIRKSTLNWADEVEGYEELRKPVNVVLPTAPKASRDYEDISDKVPLEPPFCAYLSNLPYDVDEEEISDFFKNMRIASMRIPKDDRGGEAKSKGYGYIEFEDRESLLDALIMRDTTLKSRRMRIEVASQMDNDRRRGGGRMDMNRDRPDRADSFGDWRSGPRQQTETQDDRRGGSGGFSRDRDRDGGGGITREGMRDRDDRSFNRDRDFGRDRDSNRDFGRDRENRDFGRDSFRRDKDEDRSGGWRDGERSNKDMDRDRGFNRGGRFDDKDRDDRRGGYGGRRFEERDRKDGFSRGGGGRDDRDTEPGPESRERPKLMLAPRTKPVEPVPVNAESVPSASIFGSAKPVDTSQREREIEAKLAKEQHDNPRDSSRERGKFDDKDRRESSRDRDDKDRRPDDRDKKSDDRDRRPDDRDRRSDDKDRRPDDRDRRPNDRDRRPDDRDRRPDDRDRRPDDRDRRPDDRDKRFDDRDRKPDDKDRRPDDRDGRPDDRDVRPDDRAGRPDDRAGRPDDRDRRSDDNSKDRDRRYDDRDRYEDNERKNVDRSDKTRPSRKVEDSPLKDKDGRDDGPPKKSFDDKKLPHKSDQKSPEKSDNRHKSEVKPEKPKREEKRDRHEKDMPKLTEPEPPNFAANNKFAFLQTDDNSD